MSLTPELVTRYTSEVRIDWHDAFVLSHPQADTVYLIDYPQEHYGNVNGFTHLFRPVPSQVVQPTRNDSGRQDLSIIWCGIQGEALAFLDQAAADREHPITCLYSIFLEGSPEPQIDPWMELSLTNISVTKEAVTAIATRADVLNRIFPREVYRVDRFPGLRRR